MRTRSLPSLPVVSGAVLCLPVRSVQRAKRSPLRTKVSAPGGTGFVKVFLNTVPIVYLPFFLAGCNMEVEKRGQTVEALHRQAALPRHEAAQRALGNTQLLAEAVARQSAVVDRTAQLIGEFKLR